MATVAVDSLLAQATEAAAGAVVAIPPQWCEAAALVVDSLDPKRVARGLLKAPAAAISRSVIVVAL